MRAALMPVPVILAVVAIEYSLFGRFELTCSPSGILKTIVPFAAEPRETVPLPSVPVIVWALTSLIQPAIKKIAATKIPVNLIFYNGSEPRAIATGFFAVDLLRTQSL